MGAVLYSLGRFVPKDSSPPALAPRVATSRPAPAPAPHVTGGRSRGAPMAASKTPRIQLVLNLRQEEAQPAEKVVKVTKGKLCGSGPRDAAAAWGGAGGAGPPA